MVKLIWIFFINFTITNNCSELHHDYKIINLNSNNTLSIKGEINKKVASNFIYNLYKKTDKKNLFVYLDTNGGSIEDGYTIISEIQKYKLPCIAERAYSMGFTIFQSCKKRYIKPYGKIMQHQISYQIEGEKAKIASYGKYVDQMEKKLFKIQAEKIGISVDNFKSKIYNNWWLFGANAINNNCADELAEIECSDELVMQNYTLDQDLYTYTYSKCPLISSPIHKTIKKLHHLPFFK